MTIDSVEYVQVSDAPNCVSVTDTPDGIVVVKDSLDAYLINDSVDSVKVNDSVEPYKIYDVQKVNNITINGVGILTSKTAGEIISAGKVVSVSNNTLIKADNTVLSTVNSVIGITTISANQGDVITAFQVGKIINLSWSWTPDLPLFVSTNGDMTQTVPTTGYSMIVGIAISATEINFEIKTPVVL